MSNVISDVNIGICNSNEYPKLYNINNLTVTNLDASFDKMVIRFRIMINSTTETIRNHLYNIHFRVHSKDIKPLCNDKGSYTKTSCDIIHKKNGIHCILAGTKLEFTRVHYLVY